MRSRTFAGRVAETFAGALSRRVLLKLKAPAMTQVVPLRAELRDPTDRVMEDDQAAYRAQEFRERALLIQRLHAANGLASVPGHCANCGEPCLPLAVYCDADCRDDHEFRLALVSRIGCPW